jgi:hypothetical protein
VGGGIEADDRPLSRQGHEKYNTFQIPENKIKFLPKKGNFTIRILKI